ncbi:MAG: glycosyltransferase [Ruminococcus sp.]|nr:glycosyltransferase [Ruminococcus sp.]
MKKILIFSHAMEIGGAEKALLGLLETIDTTKYEVDLFLMRHQGELMKYIPSNINLLPEEPHYASMAIPIIQTFGKRQFRVALGRINGKMKARKRVDELNIQGENDISLDYSHKYTMSAMPQISEKQYDLAISFLTPHYYVANKVKAHRKIAWIHTDYSIVQVDQQSQLEMWDAYDCIASISDNVTDSFLQVFPELEAKVKLLPNIIPIRYLYSLADANNVQMEFPSQSTVKLLSIGRFCQAKNFDNIPDICRIIRSSGIDVKWYIIGYGGDEQFIKDKIAATDMQDHVIMLGKKENPYPYIKACDIYVQPSRYEGKCVSVLEAQLLHKPVIITSYPTSSSQLEDGFDGIIVPMDNDECAQGICRVLSDTQLQNTLIENTYQRDYLSHETLEKIYDLLEKEHSE